MKKLGVIIFIFLWVLIFSFYPPANSSSYRKSIKADNIEETLKEENKDEDLKEKKAESKISENGENPNTVFEDHKIEESNNIENQPKEESNNTKNQPKSTDNNEIEKQSEPDESFENKEVKVNKPMDNDEEKDLNKNNKDANIRASKTNEEDKIDKKSLNPEKENEKLIGFTTYPIGEADSLKAGFLGEKNNDYTVTGGDLLFADVIWTWEKRYDGVFGTVFRQIHYRNKKGEEIVAPFYCMKADQKGLFKDSDGESIREISKSYTDDERIKRILYYGYGGINDITQTFDPTNGKGNWGNWINRYIYTHMALSYVYSGQLNNASEQELNEYGFYTFVNKLINTPIPRRDKITFKIYGDKTDGKENISVDCSYWPIMSSKLGWIKEAFSDSAFVSPKIEVNCPMDDNGINVYRQNNSNWIMGYWTSKKDYKIRGIGNPRILKKGERINLLKGSSFMVAFSKEKTNDFFLAFDLKKSPVKYLIVNGTSQAGYDGNFQDFGAVVYEGETPKSTITLKPKGYGNIKINKKDKITKEAVSGATYACYANKDIKIGKNLIYKEGQLIDNVTTDISGNANINYLLEGTYKLVEEGVSNKEYKISKTSYLCNVKSKLTTFLNVTDEKYQRGKLILYKEDEDTKEKLIDGEFDLYEYSEKYKEYRKLKQLSFKEEDKDYEADLKETDDNLGKFKVVEVKAPKGYNGNFSKEISLDKDEIEIIATNKKIHNNKCEITIGKRIIENYRNRNNGQPVFVFDIDGTTFDNKNIHRQEIMSINRGDYKEITISNLPEGTYTLREEDNLLYKNIDILPESDNVSIGNEGCKINLNNKAKVTFVNKKIRDDGFTHNDLVINNFSLEN